MSDTNVPPQRDLTRLRVEYGKHSLSESDVDPDPIRQLIAWLDQAIAAGVDEPSGMTLATCDQTGPHARIVLLKTIDQRGLVFATNYDSRKGREIASTPQAGLLFWWPPLERQVRIEGIIEKTSPEESRKIFDARPPGARLAAAASHQSQVIASRADLEKRIAELEKKYPDGNVPCPQNWGGYRLVPSLVEFWQGGANRLHDRIEYVREKGKWKIQRLAP
jgi:pyridoxamine 5'-phosphate oxidase